MENIIVKYFFCPTQMKCFFWYKLYILKVLSHSVNIKLVAQHISFIEVIISINVAFVARVIDEKLTERIHFTSFDTRQ